MNYIGHSLISLEKNKENLFGNFSGDFYKGRIEELILPDNIRKGVILHRQIDTVTDTNNRLVNEINEKFGLYKGIMSDIFIDHFLSTNIEKITNRPIEIVTSEIINEVDKYESYYTERFKELYILVKENEVLNKYHDMDVLRRVFRGLSKRVRNGEILNLAVDELEKNYELFEELAIIEFLRVKKEVK